MATVKMKLDPANPPKLSAATRARMAAMTEAEVEAGAVGDPDNPPLSSVELERMGAARLAREARAASGLSQARFAQAFRINAARLRDLEQGRYKTADSALEAYLRVIQREPEAVKRALNDVPASATPRDLIGHHGKRHGWAVARWAGAGTKGFLVAVHETKAAAVADAKAHAALGKLAVFDMAREEGWPIPTPEQGTHG